MTARLHARVLGAVSAFALLVLAAGAVGVAPGAGAQTDSGANLDGYVLSATGDAVTLMFDQPSLGLPFAPVMDGGMARSASTLSGGPTGYAVASIFWPGAAAANGGPQFGFPSYPIRGESFFPQGPYDSGYTNFPQVTMKSHAKDFESNATTSIDGFAIPGLMDAVRVASGTSTKLTADLAVSEAVAGMSKVTLFGGQIVMDAVTTTAKATSDGEIPVLSGVSTVVGLRVAGNAATIDSNGITFAGQSPPAGPKTVNEVGGLVLGQAGITMRLVGPNDVIVGSAGSRTIGGVLLRIEGRALAAVVANLPQALQQQLAPYLKYDADLTIVLAGVSVSSSAAKSDGGVFDVGDVLSLEDTLSPEDLGLTDTGAADGGFGLPSDLGDATVSTTASGPARGSRNGAIDVQRAASDTPLSSGGIPAVLILVVLAAALLGARGMRIASDRLLAAGAGAERCPLQESRSVLQRGARR